MTPFTKIIRHHSRPKTIAFWLLLLIGTSGLITQAWSQFTFVNVGHAPSPRPGLSVAGGVALSGNYAYVACGYDGLRIYDVSDPTNPVSVGHGTNNGFVWGVTVRSNYAYATGIPLLQIYDVSTPTNPTQVSFRNGGYTPTAIVTVGDMVMVGDADDLLIFDVSNPSVPLVAQVTNIGHFVRHITTATNYAYLTGEGFQICDLSTPTNVFPLSFRNTHIPSSTTCSAVLGNYAYVGLEADAMFLLLIYDISNPANPTQVAALNARPNALLAWGPYLLFHDSQFHDSQLRLFDVSNPVQPLDIGHTTTNKFYQTGNFPRLATSGNYVYLANGGDGLRIYLLIPQLKIELASTNAVVLSWSRPVAPGFVLQSSPDSSVANWTTVTNTPLVVSNRNQVTLPSSGKNTFFRLKFE